jgi:nicotinamidase-related amidase
MADLLALLSQQASASSLQPRKALIVLGLQNDFLSPNGKLPIPDTAFVDRLVHFVPQFREFGDVVWIRTLSEPSALAKTSLPEGETVIATDEHVSCSAPAKRSKVESLTVREMSSVALISRAEPAFDMCRRSGPRAVPRLILY